MTDYKIGERYPLPPRKLRIKPKHWVDDNRPADTKPLPPSWRERKDEK